jgi:hypothetical protein
MNQNNHKTNFGSARSTEIAGEREKSRITLAAGFSSLLSSSSDELSLLLLSSFFAGGFAAGFAT